MGAMAYIGAICNQMHMVYWIIGKFYAKNQGPKSKDEKVICLFERQVLWLIEVLYAVSLKSPF